MSLSPSFIGSLLVKGGAEPVLKNFYGGALVYF